MSEIKILKPAVSGSTVRDPKTREKLPSEGKAVRMTTFWRRRLLDGSVVEVQLKKGRRKDSDSSLGAWED